MVCAPFVFVQFADFWLGDQLNTLVQVLKDFEYSLCFYTQGINWYMDSRGEAGVGLASGDTCDSHCFSVSLT